jgi:hypothetical protein
MISYLNFIKLLDTLNIQLYDFQKRISYYRLNNLKLDNLNQVGGSINKNELLYKLGKVQLEKIILNLLNNDIVSVKVLCNHYNC